MTLEQGAGVFLGLATLIYTLVRWRIDHKRNYIEMQLSRKANQATFWLELEKMFGKHDDAHVKLRPGGKWNFFIGEEFQEDLRKNRISNNLRLEFEKNGIVLSQNTTVSAAKDEWLIDGWLIVVIVYEDRNQERFTRLNVTAHRFTVQEWASVEDYMGLFEHCKIMLDKEMLDWDTFMKIFAYRIGNILNNRFIVKEKLVIRASGWKDFITLLGELRSREPLKWEKRIERVRQWGVRA